MSHRNPWSALPCVCIRFVPFARRTLLGKDQDKKKVRAPIVPFLTGGRTERLGGSGEEREGGREKRPNQSKNLKEKKEPGGGNPSPTTLFFFQDFKSGLTEYEGNNPSSG